MERFSPVAWLNRPYEYLPPVLIGRAGLDSTDINRSVEVFVSRMFALNGDINLLNHPLGRHGFDAYDDNEQSRDVIAATVAFLKSRLSRPSEFAAKRARAAGELQALFAEGKIEAAREFVRTALSTPGDKAITAVLVSEARLTSAGNSLRVSSPTAAVAAYEWAVELSPLSPNAHSGLAAGYEAAGQKDQAIAEAKKALDLLEKASDMSENWKKMIREAATALLERLDRIHDAARRGDVETVSQLLSREPGLVNAKDLYGHTPLHLAVIYDQRRIVELLVEKGADINLMSTSGASALNYAEGHGRAEIAKLLIGKGAKPSLRRWPVIRGDYLGLKTPGRTPELFAPGIVSSPYWEHSPLVFSPDGTEVFWSVVFEDSETGVILVMKRVKDEWVEPQVLPFSKARFRDICPTLSTDGKTLRFTSCRPTSEAGKAGDFNIWFVTRSGEGWSEPQLLAPGIASGKDARAVFTKDGSMYFGSWREGSIDGSNIYRSAVIDGQYAKPVRLDAPFNTGNAMPAYIAPNEEYLLFESFRAGGYGGCDFWIGVRQPDGSWGEAINLGGEVNSKFDDWFGGFSPDGKYFFFVSSRNGNNDLYWVEAGVIEEITD
jgi:tetratricopeptide (TPR) repeat protein